MISNPGIGQKVQVWYRAEVAPHMPLHGSIGYVTWRARGKGPKNHGVCIDGRVYAIPCGNLRATLDRP